jgi:hypothetical protein
MRCLHRGWGCPLCHSGWCTSTPPHRSEPPPLLQLQPGSWTSTFTGTAGDSGSRTWQMYQLVGVHILVSVAFPPSNQAHAQCKHLQPCVLIAAPQDTIACVGGVVCNVSVSLSGSCSCGTYATRAAVIGCARGAGALLMPPRACRHSQVPQRRAGTRQQQSASACIVHPVRSSSSAARGPRNPDQVS